MSEKSESELKSALAKAERTLCKLRAKREELEAKIETINQAERPNPWLLANARAEIEPLNDRIGLAQIEVLSLRVLLLQPELPKARLAIEPQRKAYEEAQTKYVEARDECNRRGAEWDRAKFAASDIERAILSTEREIEELQLASLKSRAA